MSITGLFRAMLLLLLLFPLRAVSQTIVVDNASSGFSTEGIWSYTDCGCSEPVNGDYWFRSGAATLTAWATWTPTLPADGLYLVEVRYREGANRTTVAPYTVSDATKDRFFFVDQTTGGGTWVALGNFILPEGSDASVRLGNDFGAGTIAVADAVRFTYIQQEYVYTYTDSESSFVTEGTWDTADCGCAEVADGDYHLAATSPEATARAVWSFDDIIDGRYSVHARFAEGVNRVGDAKYLVSHNGGISEFAVNQQTDGGKWVSLGEFNFLQGDILRSASLTNESSSSGVVIADSIRLVRRGSASSSVANSPFVEILYDIPPPVVGGEVFEGFKVVGAAADGTTEVTVYVGASKNLIRNDGLRGAILTSRDLDVSGEEGEWIDPGFTWDEEKQAWKRRYRAPLQYPGDDSPESTHAVELDLLANTLSLPVVGETVYQVQLAKPPVLLVHGLWGGPDAWETLPDLLEEKGWEVQNVDYKSTNDQGYLTNRDVVPRNIALARWNMLINREIAADKVDIVAHSMGGQLGRMYMQSLSGDSYRPYRDDVRKFITVGTPWSGSQFANFLVTADCGRIARNIVRGMRAAATVYGLETLDPDGSMPVPDAPAVRDLRVNSWWHGRLNSDEHGPRVLPSGVYVHAIAGRAVPEPVDLGVLGQYESLGSGQWILASIVESSEGVTPVAVLGESSDLIVAEPSARGGLAAPYSSVITPVIDHSGMKDQPVMTSHVISLLKEDLGAPGGRFATNFPTPPAQTYTDPCPPESKRQGQSDFAAKSVSVSIITPDENQAFAPGDLVDISISAPGEVSSVLVGFMGDYTTSTLAVVGCPSCETSLQIPEDAAGVLALFAVALSDDELVPGNQYDVRAIQVIPDSAPDSIFLVPGDSLTTAENDVARYDVFAAYGAITRNVTSLTTATVAQGSIATVSAPGVLWGVAEGSTELVIGFAGISTNATLTVLAAAESAAGSDSDGDGLSDDDETALGLNPNSADSDNDGIDDLQELEEYGTFPDNSDTDGDGVSDGEEISAGYDPLNNGNTPPVPEGFLIF